MLEQQACLSWCHRGATSSWDTRPVVFCVVPELSTELMRSAIAMVRETEGVTVVLKEADAQGLAAGFRAEWITLNVHSDLAAVGLTAAFSRALADADISCNVMAGVYHDHIFVPYGDGTRALEALHHLARATTEP